MILTTSAFNLKKPLRGCTSPWKKKNGIPLDSFQIPSLHSMAIIIYNIELVCIYDISYICMCKSYIYIYIYMLRYLFIIVDRLSYHTKHSKKPQPWRVHGLPKFPDWTQKTTALDLGFLTFGPSREHRNPAFTTWHVEIHKDHSEMWTSNWLAEFLIHQQIWYLEDIDQRFV